MGKSTKTHRLTVCLLSHHPLVLEEFRGLLATSQMRVQTVRLESTPLADLKHTSVPQATVYILDAQAPRPLSESLIAAILEQFPGARVMVLAAEFPEALSFSLLQMGARGLVNYAQARKQLPKAVRAVAAGGYWVPRTVLSRFVEFVLKDVRGRRPAGGPSRLSQREQQVLDALLENLSNKEIANKLNISERTVKFHVSNLLAKFGVQRRADLIVLCFQQVEGPRTVV